MIEFETKILNINIDEIKQKLKNLGAKYIWIKNFRRYTYDFNPIDKNKWIRLRTDWYKTTLTIKEIVSNSIDWTFEHEIIVSDFDKTNEILEKLGYKYKQYQENKRESFNFNWVEIEIDSWPLIPTYLEIEWKSKKEVENTVKLLWFELTNTTSENTADIYYKYWVDFKSIKYLTF
jgi:adenylate cyclase class 2